MRPESSNRTCNFIGSFEGARQRQLRLITKKPFSGKVEKFFSRTETSQSRAALSSFTGNFALDVFAVEFLIG